MEDDYEEVFALAFRKAKWCFNDQSFAAITTSFQSSCLPEAVAKLFNKSDSHRMDNSVPTSAEEFLTRASCVFSVAFIRHLDSKLKAFDALCGGQIAGQFLSAGSHEAWAHVIADNTLCYYLAMVSKSQHPRGSPSPADPEKPMAISQVDGSTDEPPPPAPISQISLKGSTLKQAWAESEDIRGMTAFERLPLQSWTPTTPGGAPVFRGTCHHQQDARCEKDLDEALSQNPTRLRRSSGRTQLFPRSDGLAGIYTSFSALRSFLWSVFIGDVIHDPPGPSATTVLEKPFRMRSQAHKGVVLVVFDSNQPAPPGISWFQIPAGKEGAWQKAVFDLKPVMSEPSTIWKNDLKVLHGQETSDFPDLIHGRELPSLRHALSRFPCNQALLWQSAWMSHKSALALNERTSAIYAISFERVEPATPEPNLGKKKTSFSILGRSLGREFKKMAGKRGGKQ